MSQQGNDLGEKALSKLVEVGVSSQLDEVEEIDVEIKTDPLKIMQGQVDSAKISAEGLVMKGDLRMEELQLQTNAIAINPLSVAFGKIELTHPTDATAEVVLTEADLNRAFNSDYIQQKLQRFEINSQGKKQTVDTQGIEFKLPGDGKFFLKAYLRVYPQNEIQKIAFTAIPHVSPDRRKILLENVEYSESEGFSPELTEALLAQTSELLNLENFELKGMSLRIQKLNLQNNKIMLLGETRIEEFPSAS